MENYTDYQNTFKIFQIPIENKFLIATPYIIAIKCSGGKNWMFILFWFIQHLIILPIALTIDIIIISIRYLITGYYDNNEIYRKSILIWLLYFTIVKLLWELIFVKFIFETLIIKVFGKAATWAAIITIIVLSIFLLFFLIKSGLWHQFYAFLEQLLIK